MPRIISGRARGIRLDAPEGRGTRPTTDRIKETVFNILNPYLADARVLDLFAGTGGLGLEAVSRGATGAVFVEMDRRCAEVLKGNVARSGLASLCEIRMMDVQAAIRLLGASGARFDLLLMDPPYKLNFVVKTLQLTEEHDIIADDGIAVVEHHPDEILPDSVGRLERVRRETYGETVFSFFVRNSPGPDAP